MARSRYGEGGSGGPCGAEWLGSSRFETINHLPVRRTTGAGIGQKRNEFKFLNALWKVNRCVIEKDRAVTEESNTDSDRRLGDEGRCVKTKVVSARNYKRTGGGPLTVMPKGVEHPWSLMFLSSSRGPLTVMPKGVEHSVAATREWWSVVPLAVMLKGVEHKRPAVFV